MNTITIARSAAAKSSLLKGTSTAPTKRRAAAHPQAPSTLRLLTYMAVSAGAVGLILYVAFVLGVSRVTPEPIHNAAPTHHTTRGTV
jgi:hypothetical protein